MKLNTTTRALLTTFVVTAVMWTSAQPVAVSVPIFSMPEAVAMGRSGPPLSDDSLPETLTPLYNRSAQGSSIFLMGVIMTGHNKVRMMSSTVVSAFGNGKPRVLIVANIPRGGWYIINCVANGSGAQASLVTAAPISFSGSPPAPMNVASWDYRNRPQGMHLFPALVELKAGTHWFYWTLDAGSVDFLETHILKAKIEG